MSHVPLTTLSIIYWMPMGLYNLNHIMGPSLDAKPYKKEIYKCGRSWSFKNHMFKNAFKKNLVWPHEVSQRILLIPASCAILLSLQCHMFLLKYYLLYIGCQCFCMIKIIPISFLFRSLVMCSFKKIEKTMES